MQGRQRLLGPFQRDDQHQHVHLRRIPDLHIDRQIGPPAEILGEAGEGNDDLVVLVEAGEEGDAVFYTEPTDLDLVAKALPEFGFTVSAAKLIYKPNNPVSMASLSAEALAEVEHFLEAIEDDDDVQHVYVGLAE